MATQDGFKLTGVISEGVTPVGITTDAVSWPEEWNAPEVFDSISWAPPRNPGQADGSPVAITVNSQAGGEAAHLGDFWFERLHVIPRKIDFGNILGVVQDQVELYNAYKTTNHDFDSFTNNIGSGVSITNLPTLPETIGAQNGLLLDLEVSTDGAPQFDDTLDFGFTNGTTLKINLTGTRVIVLPMPPETPLLERIEFKTDILEARDGSEQRVSTRKHPRLSYELDFTREYGAEYSRIEYLMYDWQHRVFGLPMWHESVRMTADASAGANTINVGDTSYSSFKVGRVALIREDELTFTALKIDAVTQNSLQFNSPLDRDYSAGVEVLPIRTARTVREYSGGRYSVGGGTFKIKFRSTDNVDDIGDTSAWNSYESKVLLDDPNAMSGEQMSETHERRLDVLESPAGTFTASSPWARPKRGHSKSFITHSRKELWELRELLYALRGRQVSFWIPTFNNQFTLTQALQSGSSDMTIEHSNYALFVDQGKGRKIVRFKFKDGTQKVTEITASTELSDTEENLTLADGWSVTYQPEDVESIDFYEQVRFAQDEIELKHEDNLGNSRTTIPVKEVFD